MEWRILEVRLWMKGEGSVAMGYAFSKTDRSVQAGLRRIAIEELEGMRGRLTARRAEALSDLEQFRSDHARLIHAYRRHVKRMRALFRLVRPVLPEAERLEARIKPLARQLGPLRDAQVRLGTLSLLEARASQPAPVGLRAALEAERDRELDALAAAPLLVTLITESRKIEDEVHHWLIEGHGFELLAPGLSLTWREGRRGFRAARDAMRAGLGTEPFHDWRKAVKYHAAQARLLEPIWPAMMAAHEGEAEALGRLLGQLNDLDVFLGYLGDQPQEDWARFAIRGPHAEAAHQLRHALAQDALAQGARFYAEKSGALMRRWSGWWQVWEQTRALD